MIPLSTRVQEIPDSASLAIAAKVKQLKSEGVNVVGFAAGEPDFDTPQVIIETGIEALKQGKTRYTPTPGISELRTATGKWLELQTGTTYEAAEVLVSSGAKHSLYNIMQAVVNPGDEVILPSPYWLSYPEQIKLAQGKTVVVDTKLENEFKITPGELAAALTDRSKAIILNSPSNPTGAVYTEEELKALGEIIIQKNLFLISDEIYSLLTYDRDAAPSPLKALPELKNRTVVVSGCSKAFAMTGWRIGLAAGPIEIISAAARIQAHSTSCACAVSQYAAVGAIEKAAGEVEKMRGEFAKRRDYMYDRLSKMDGVEVFKPTGAFYMFPDVSSFYGRSTAKHTVKGSVEFAGSLLDEQRVAVVPGAAFGMDAGIRLSYANSMEEIEKGLDKLETFLNSFNDPS